jgi:glycosyltransferase involved in cell wall biosynthesis
MISREFPPGPQVGGVGRGTVNLATALGELGHDVVVITEDLGLGTADGPFSVRTWQAGDPSRRFYLRQRLGRRWEVAQRLSQSEAALRVAAREAASGGRFDVIDTWLWGAEAARFGHHRHLGPLLVRLSSPDFEIREQHGMEERCDLDALDQRCLDHADVIAAISEQNVELIAGRFRLDRQKVELTPLGVPIDVADSPPSESSRARQEILYVGRLEGRKGVEDLLRAVPEILGARPDATLTLIGRATGHSDRGQPFETFADEFLPQHVRARITFAGSVSDRDLREAYRRAAVAVFPSRYESFGLVILEAMLHGTPVVATTAGGIPEVAGRAALLVPPNDPAEIAGAIVKVLVDDALRASLGRAGAERARGAFTTLHMAEATIRAYKRLTDAAVFSGSGPSALANVAA